MPEKPFEGLWSSCFFLDERGKTYCVYEHIAQNDKHLTIISEEFASYRVSFYTTEAQVDETGLKAVVTTINGDTQATDFSVYLICERHRLYMAQQGQTCEQLLADESKGFSDRVLGFDLNMEEEVATLLEEIAEQEQESRDVHP